MKKFNKKSLVIVSAMLIAATSASYAIDKLNSGVSAVISEQASLINSAVNNASNQAANTVINSAASQAAVNAAVQASTAVNNAVQAATAVGTNSARNTDLTKTTVTRYSDLGKVGNVNIDNVNIKVDFNSTAVKNATAKDIKIESPTTDCVMPPITIDLGKGALRSLDGKTEMHNTTRDVKSVYGNTGLEPNTVTDCVLPPIEPPTSSGNGGTVIDTVVGRESVDFQFGGKGTTNATTGNGGVLSINDGTSGTGGDTGGNPGGNDNPGGTVIDTVVGRESVDLRDDSLIKNSTGGHTGNGGVLNTNYDNPGSPDPNPPEPNKPTLDKKSYIDADNDKMYKRVNDADKVDMSTKNVGTDYAYDSDAEEDKPDGNIHKNHDGSVTILKKFR